MSTILPILQGTFPPALEFIPALIIGVLFGVALEKAGFGNAKYLAGQFYFHDLRVFKVMFTAIITAAAGVAILTSTGLLSMELLYVPDTFLIPLLVGGLVLGAGFMLSAYCPGTSIVAMASGKWDGLVTVIGVIAGSVVFGEIYPLIHGFYVSTAKGVLTFPTLLHIPFSVLIAVLVIAAFAAFLGADKVEGIFARKLNMPQGTRMTAGGRKALAAVFSLSIVAIVFQYALPQTLSIKAPEKIAEITPVELAQMLIEEPRALYVVDARRGSESGGKESIPGSARLDDIKENIDGLYKGRTMVVYSQNGQDRVEARLLKYEGRIVCLSGGFNAWESQIMGKPEQAYQACLNATDSDSRKTISMLHAAFTGVKVEAPVGPAANPAAAVATPKRRGGCS